MVRAFIYIVLTLITYNATAKTKGTLKIHIKSEIDIETLNNTKIKDKIFIYTNTIEPISWGTLNLYYHPNECGKDFCIDIPFDIDAINTFSSKKFEIDIKLTSKDFEIRSVKSQFNYSDIINATVINLSYTILKSKKQSERIYLPVYRGDIDDELKTISQQVNNILIRLTDHKKENNASLSEISSSIKQFFQRYENYQEKLLYTAELQNILNEINELSATAKSITPSQRISYFDLLHYKEKLNQLPDDEIVKRLLKSLLCEEYYGAYIYAYALEDQTLSRDLNTIAQKTIEFDNTTNGILKKIQLANEILDLSNSLSINTIINSRTSESKTTTLKIILPERRLLQTLNEYMLELNQLALNKQKPGKRKHMISEFFIKNSFSDFVNFYLNDSLQANLAAFLCMSKTYNPTFIDGACENKCHHSWLYFNGHIMTAFWLHYRNDSNAEFETSFKKYKRTFLYTTSKYIDKCAPSSDLARELKNQIELYGN